MTKASYSHNGDWSCFLAYLPSHPCAHSVVMLRRILAAAAAGSNARTQYKCVASSIASPHNRLLFLSCSTCCSPSSCLVVLKHQQRLLRNSITSVGDGLSCCFSASIRCSFSTKSVCTIHFTELGSDVRFSLAVCVAVKPQKALLSSSGDSVRVLRPASSSSGMLSICLDD